jgi:hypothetical protein
LFCRSCSAPRRFVIVVVLHVDLETVTRSREVAPLSKARWVYATTTQLGSASKPISMAQP